MPAGHGGAGVSDIGNVADTRLSEQASLVGIASPIDSADVAGGQAINCAIVDTVDVISVIPGGHAGSADHNADGHTDSISGTLPNASADGHIETQHETLCGVPSPSMSCHGLSDQLR